MINRIFEIRPYNGGRSLPCFDCPVRGMCDELDENGQIKRTIDNSQLPIKNPVLKIERHNPMVDLAIIDPEIGELYRLMGKCKRGLPKYTIVDCGEKKHNSEHILINKRGQTILSSNNYGGLILQVLINSIVTIIVIGLIGLVISGIASIFE